MSYDPTIGRFISQDPIAFDGGDANLDRYVGNSPTNFVDPTGLKFITTGGKDIDSESVLKWLAKKLNMERKDLQKLADSEVWKCLKDSKQSVFLHFDSEMRKTLGGATHRRKDGAVSIGINPDPQLDVAFSKPFTPEDLLYNILHELVHGTIYVGCPFVDQDGNQVNDDVHDEPKNLPTYPNYRKMRRRSDMNQTGTTLVDWLFTQIKDQLGDNFPTKFSK